MKVEANESRDSANAGGLGSKSIEKGETRIRDRIRDLRRVRASSLVANPKNWRKHPRAQQQALRALLNGIGYADALLVRELDDGRLMIIDGHLRADTTPDAEVPVLISDVTAEEADKLLLTIDPLASLAESDSERISDLVQSVRVSDPAIRDLLRRTAGERLWEILHPEEIKEAEVAPERGQELQKKWQTNIGQVYQIGVHRLAVGDCRDVKLIDRLWNRSDARIRAIVTDPPYGVTYSEKNTFLNKTDRGNRIQRPIENDHLTADETGALLRDALVSAIAHCERGASIYTFVPGGSLLVKFINALEAAGFSLKGTLVWVKNHFVLGMSDYQPKHELVLYGWLSNGPHFWAGDRSQVSVFDVDRPHSSPDHPTCKPIKLLLPMVNNSSQPGDLIFDPFSGSGSTLVAAQQVGRIGYGVEIDPIYAAVVLERLSMFGLKVELVTEQ